MSISISNLQEIRDYLVNVAKEAGQLLLASKSTTVEFTPKKNTTDIVTVTDRAVEELISTRLKAKYPEYSFIGEETFEPDKGITNTPSWIVDPIDGTSNFVHGLPSVCISLGFVVEKKPTVGVVYNPFLEELHTAVKGAGAFYQRGHGESLSLPFNRSPLQGLGPACIGADWGSDREGVNFDLNLKVFTTLVRTMATGGRFVNSLRFAGCASESICRVASGQQEIFWECGCWAWDVAAAWCILNEAGGLMVDGHPGEWCPPIDNRRYLAIRPAVSGQKELVREFWDVIGDDRSTYGP